MLPDHDRDAMYQQVAELLPHVRDLVPDDLAAFAAGLVCELHQQGLPCTADCPEVARDVLALLYLVNTEPTPEEPCLACHLSGNNNCLYHDGADQAIFEAITDEFVSRRPRQSGLVGRLARRWWHAWWVPRFTITFLALLGVVGVVAEPLLHRSATLVIAGDMFGLICITGAMLILAKVDLEKPQ